MEQKIVDTIKQARVYTNTTILLSKDALNIKAVETYRNFVAISNELSGAFQELRKSNWQLGLFLKEYNVPSPYNSEHADASKIKPTADVTDKTLDEVREYIVKQDIKWKDAELVHKIDFLRERCANAIRDIEMLMSTSTGIPFNRATLCIRHLEYARCYYGEVLALIREEYNLKLGN